MSIWMQVQNESNIEHNMDIHILYIYAPFCHCKPHSFSCTFHCIYDNICLFLFHENSKMTEKVKVLCKCG